MGTEKANDRQVSGDHYKTGGLEHWDICSIFDLDYFQGQITKYIFRWKKKGGIDDLKKAQHFLQKYIEIGSPWVDPAPSPPKGLDIRYAAPKSDDYFTYEGGFKDRELYTCKRCKAHFETPLYAAPSMYHSHPEEPSGAYANQE